MAALVGVDKVAKALNITPRRVQQLVNEGLPREERGRYDLGRCMLWYIRFLQEALQQKGGGEGAADGLRSEKRRLTALEASLKELELAKARGEVIAIAEFETAQSAMVATTRAHLLNLPAKAAPQLVGLGRPQIQKKLTQAVHTVLKTLAEQKGKRPVPVEDEDV